MTLLLGYACIARVLAGGSELGFPDQVKDNLTDYLHVVPDPDCDAMRRWGPPALYQAHSWMALLGECQ
jgi:hypothetical protein